jgi:uncharacterized protein YqeY
MSLTDRLNEDMKQAMKNKDKFRLSVIRMVRSSIQNSEIELRRPLNEDEALDILNREIKQRRESLQEFEKGNRMDLVEGLQAELNVLTEYQPPQLSDEELEQIVQQTIQEVGATSKADMGKVMGAIVPKVKGRADGRLVNQKVQAFLS